MKSDNIDQDFDRPVAYDANGQPLYSRPAKSSHQTVHIVRPASPEKVEISQEQKQRHDISASSYPDINLSDGEYVINAFSRHPIGMVVPVLISLLLLVFSLFSIANIKYLTKSILVPGDGLLNNILVGFLILFIFFVLAALALSFFVYSKNRFFLTNESVIQEIQTGLFYRHEQTVSLMNIEDASFYKGGLLQHIFDYGTIRLSTEGDETTYLFTFVANPKKQIAILNNAVESFKNGRPVDEKSC